LTVTLIEKIEVSETFWKDLEHLRKHPAYTALRKAVAEFVSALAAGQPTREARFRNPAFAGVYHIALTGDLWLFYTRPEPGTVKLCLIGDHSTYGFKGKHRGREAATAQKIRSCAERPSLRRPDWDRFSWKRPADILESADLEDLSDAAIAALAGELAQEMDDFARLQRLAGAASLAEVPDTLAESWLDAMIEAEIRVSDVRYARRGPRDGALAVAEFCRWQPAPLH
jgi:mRNA-degrading endonuclease YafQ of YafQ-DinJ toxin-antitoxin module